MTVSNATFLTRLGRAVDRCAGFVVVTSIDDGSRERAATVDARDGQRAAHNPRYPPSSRSRPQIQTLHVSSVRSAPFLRRGHESFGPAFNKRGLESFGFHLVLQEQDPETMDQQPHHKR